MRLTSYFTVFTRMSDRVCLFSSEIFRPNYNECTADICRGLIPGSEVRIHFRLFVPFAVTYTCTRSHYHTVAPLHAKWIVSQRLHVNLMSSTLRLRICQHGVYHTAWPIENRPLALRPGVALWRINGSFTSLS